MIQSCATTPSRMRHLTSVVTDLDEAARLTFLALCRLGFPISFKGAQPGPVPACDEIGGRRAIIRAVPELPGYGEKRAEQGCAVIVREFH